MLSNVNLINKNFNGCYLDPLSLPLLLIPVIQAKTGTCETFHDALLISNSLRLNCERN